MNDKKLRLMKVGIEEGEKIFAKILKDYPELDNDDLRRTSVITSLLVHCLKMLESEGLDAEHFHAMIDRWIEE